MSDIDCWAHFLADEKMYPDKIGGWIHQVIVLCENLAKKYGRPKIKPYKEKLETRRKIVEVAMDMQFDLTAIIYKGKLVMSRGLLDAWNKEYIRRHGSNIGTAGWKESIRRDVKTRIHDQFKKTD